VVRTVLLAGGFGTRLAEESESKPKPMVEVGGRPILWHIMRTYAERGFKEFVVALGYRGDMIKRYFLDYYYFRNNLSIDLRTNQISVGGTDCEDWIVHLRDTGLHTQTGGRLRRLADLLRDETFMMTYGDGVCSIDVRALLDFHRRHGKLATVTAVRPPSRFGGLVFDGDLVSEFSEKPQIGEGWINGGFFVLEPEVLSYIPSDDTLFERGPLERLARDGQLVAYRHEGFWQCMDTLRDVRLLNSLCDGRVPPWDPAYPPSETT
jgi:glucose-1-phosphate cytidylyltransferase